MKDILTAESQYNSALTVEDITKPVDIDLRNYRLITYSHPDDICEDRDIHLCNQSRFYPFHLLGHDWKSVEYLYLCGEWSWQGISSEGFDSVAIQEDILKARSGYQAHTYTKQKHRKKIRKDFQEFRDQWMLWCVWNKCKASSDFRNHLLSIPEDRIIVEVVKHDPIWAVCPDKEGRFIGNNGMGKILTICRNCLKDNTEPDINTDLLNRSEIYILGEKIQF